MGKLGRATLGNLQGNLGSTLVIRWATVCNLGQLGVMFANPWATFGILVEPLRNLGQLWGTPGPPWASSGHAWATLGNRGATCGQPPGVLGQASAKSRQPLASRLPWAISQQIWLASGQPWETCGLKWTTWRRCLKRPKATERFLNVAHRLPNVAHLEVRAFTSCSTPTVPLRGGGGVEVHIFSQFLSTSAISHNFSNFAVCLSTLRVCWCPVCLLRRGVAP